MSVRGRGNSGADAVGRDEGGGIGVGGGDAGRGDGEVLGFAGGHGEVEFEELGEEVFLGVEAVGGEDGGVEGGVGVFEWGFAGEFEGAVEGAEAAIASTRYLCCSAMRRRSASATAWLSRKQSITRSQCCQYSCHAPGPRSFSKSMGDTGRQPSNLLSRAMRCSTSGS